MQPQSPESNDQKEAPKTKETIVPPEIICPLARAMQQRFLPDMSSVPESAAKDEFEKKLLELQTKEIKLVAGNNPDFPVWGIECLEKLENKPIIPSTTFIDWTIMKKLGPALQDYLINSAVAAKMPQSVINFIRVMTNSKEIIINNTKEGSVFAGSLAESQK